MNLCYIGIGANLGDRRGNVARAIQAIAALKETRVIKLSTIIESIPQGMSAAEPKFLNAAAKIQTGLAPRPLLKALQAIEVKLGRSRKHPRWVSRPIDLDILFYGNRTINSDDFIIPHPRIAERPFVLEPLLEIL
jgi:2-amino-4-hydroxy-6-hydroxymethyldihydropteridine diphosphokinase